MNNFTSLATAFVAISMSIPSFGQGITTNPERVNHQDGSYDATSNTVTITAEAPTMTEYDWDTYTQQELPYISYIAIHRHRPGTEWSDEELGRITNPEPGKVIEFVDNTVEPDKQYEYGITVHVDDLQSQQAYLQIYTGITPGYLKSFTARAVPGNPNAVEMTAVAPDTAETGESLDGSILSIHVQQYSGSFSYSDIHTIDGVKPGQTYSWTIDNLESDKLYTFRAMAYVGNEGKGGFSEANVYLGLDYPGSPQNATCSQEGEGVRITWEAPAAGGRGGDYDPEHTTYTLVRVYSDGTREVVAKGITSTEYVDTPDFEEEMSVSYEISAVNAAGESTKAASTATVSIGKAASLPFTESFAYGAMSHKGWQTETTQDDEYYTYVAWSFPETTLMYYFPTDENLTIVSQDTDRGMAQCDFYGFSPDGQTESMSTPHIDVDGMTGIDISFWLYYVPDGGTDNELRVYASRDDSDWEQLFTTDGLSGNQPEWREIKLKANTDGCKKIKLKWSAIAHNGSPTDVIIDNISIKNGDTSDGIAKPETDNGETSHRTEYFRLTGERVSTPAHGIFIVRKDGKTTKQVFK